MRRITGFHGGKEETAQQNESARGLHAGELVKVAAQPLGGSGGGRPTLAQAGGKDPSQLNQSLASADEWIKDKL